MSQISVPRFAANISLMYADLPFLDRFEAAAADGFRAVEFLFPYEWPAQELHARLKANGLQQVLFNTPPGGSDADSIARAWQAGDKGLASVPGREAECRQAFALALDYASKLECPRIHVMVGLVQEGVDRATQRATLIANVTWAAKEAHKQGVDVLIEPINTRDIPGFFLNRQDDAHAILAEVGEPNAKVQMDLYHCQIVEGDVAQKIREYLPTGRVGHFQIAGTPGRHEPDIGELNYPYLFGVIAEVAAACNKAGWGGWIGCEYRPLHGAEAGGTSRGLGWLRAAMASGLAER